MNISGNRREEEFAESERQNKAVRRKLKRAVLFAFVVAAIAVVIYSR